MLQPVALAHKSLADYTHIVGRPLVEEIRELAEPLKGKRVVQLSATAFGGGVSEILYTLIPLMRDVGLEVEWQVIYGREEFFNSTKLMHNALQGAPQDLTEEQWATWFQYNEMNARELSRGWDVCLVHDPQPAAMLVARAREGEGVGVALPHRRLDAEPGDDGAAAPLHPALSGLAVPRRQLRAAGHERRRPHRAAGDRPARAEEHGALARGRDLRLQAVRDRHEPPDDVPGLALRPVEGPARRDRRLPHRQGGASRRPARARRLDGLRRPRGLGLLQLHARPRRRRSRTSTSSTTSTTSGTSRSTRSSRSPTS